MPRWATTAASAFLALVSCVGGLTLAPATAAAGSQPLNIVVLMVDDLGVMDDRLLSVLPTINDTFLQHGVRFTDYIGSDPLCCPGRTSFLTGQYAHHTGVTVNDGRLFDPSETIATELEGVGYQTFMVGKYLNKLDLLTNKMPPGWTKAFLSHGGQYWGGTYYLNGQAITTPNTVYGTDELTDYATKWIGQADEQRPIFLYLTPPAPHFGVNDDESFSPLQPSPPTRYLNDPRCTSIAPWKPPNYAEADVSDKPVYVQKSHAYFPNGWPLARTCEAMLAVDDQLAQVKAAMAAAGRTNTVYLFTSDNGMSYGEHGLNKKEVPYSTPMPLFVRWDAAIGSAPHSISTTVSNVDMAPTLCALAGCQMGPYPDGFGVDGISFAPVLRGTATGTGRQFVLEESPGQSIAAVPRWAGVRTTDENALGRWVYTEYETGECELYNLTADPWELRNHCNDPGGPYAHAQAQLAAALKTLRRVPAGPQCTSTCYVDAFNGRDSYGGASPLHAKQHIQAAIDTVSPGGEIRVLPGHYTERATGRSPVARSGTYNFGLFVPATKPGISIVGVDPLDQPITDPKAIKADIQTIGDASFGPVGVYVEAANTTFQGLEINGNLDPGTMDERDGETFEVVANGFALRDSATKVPHGGSIWFFDPKGVIASYNITGNAFLDGTSINSASHTGTTGQVANREIKTNTFALGGATHPAIDFDGADTTVPRFKGQVGGATIENNSFSGGRTYIRSRGTVVAAEFDWSSWFVDNTFDGAVMVGPNPLANNLTGYLDNCSPYKCPQTREITATIQRQIDHARTGDTVYVKAGRYHESPDITKSVKLKSATGRLDTTIALGTGPTELGALSIEAPDVTVDGFTIVGRDGTPSHTAGTDILVATGLDGVTIQNNRLRIGEIDNATSNGNDGIGILTTSTTTSTQFVDTLTISNNIFQPLNGSAFRAWQIKPGVTNLTITGNTVSGTFDMTATVQAAAGMVSNNTIVGSGSSASIGAFGYPDPNTYGQTTFQGNDISRTSSGIIVSEANNVTIKNNLIHAVGTGVVLSDPGHFSAELAGSTVHINNNSITGASVKLLTNAYPAPVNGTGTVDASGNWWGTTSESNIAAGVSGQADFTPYLDRGTDVSGTAGFQGDHGTVHVSALGGQTGGKRLDEAVDLVDPSGTIIAGPGAFTGNITVGKAVTLHGAHFGDAVAGRNAGDSSESRVNGTITLAAPDITVDGFSISDSASSNVPAFGVVVRTASPGATISHDVFDGITSSGSGATAEGINLQNGPDNVTITDNRIANVSGAGLSGAIVVGDANATDASSNIDIERNVINGITSASSDVYGVALDGPGSDADVRGNTIGNLSAANGDTVGVWFGANDALDDAIVRRNSLDVGPSGYGIAVDTSGSPTGSVDGTCNWWGDPSGPGFGSGSKVSSDVTFTPWLSSSDLAGDCIAPEVGSAAPDAIGSEGQTLTTSGSFTSGGPTVPTITKASGPGIVTDHGDGTWSWSYATTDNFPSTTITVRATVNGSRAEDRFVARAVNVAPTAAFTPPGSVRYGSTFHPSLAHAGDASSADKSAGFHFAFDCGTGSGFSTLSPSPSANCVAPADPGTITVRGRVVDKDGGERTYSGTVHITQQKISLTPATVAFGTVSSGTRTRTFTVTNVGTASLAVHDASLSGVDAGEYSIAEDGCSGVSVAVNATCTITVKFVPTTDGRMSASLVVDSNDPHLPSAHSSLTGTAARSGTIRIRLVTHPGSVSSPFTFTGTPGIGSFQLPTSGSFVRLIQSPAPASYTITETNSSSWPLIGLTCTTAQTIDLAHRSVTIQLAVGATVDCTFVNSRRLADEMIGTAPNGPFAGNNVYSGVPVASQRAQQVVPGGKFKSFWVVLQNDSLDRDSFGVAASYTGSTQFQMKIWRGSVDISTAVFSGAYTLTGLAPGGQVKLHIVVSAASNAPLTSTGKLQLVLRSKSGPHAVDLVEADVSAQ